MGVNEIMLHVQKWFDSEFGTGDTDIKDIELRTNAWVEDLNVAACGPSPTVEECVGITRTYFPESSPELDDDTDEDLSGRCKKFLDDLQSGTGNLELRGSSLTFYPQISTNVSYEACESQGYSDGWCLYNADQNSTDDLRNDIDHFLFCDAGKKTDYASSLKTADTMRSTLSSLAQFKSGDEVLNDLINYYPRDKKELAFAIVGHFGTDAQVVELLSNTYRKRVSLEEILSLADSRGIDGYAIICEIYDKTLASLYKQIDETTLTATDAYKLSDEFRSGFHKNFMNSVDQLQDKALADRFRGYAQAKSKMLWDRLVENYKERPPKTEIVYKEVEKECPPCYCRCDCSESRGGGGGTCFPGNAYVFLESGEAITMKELAELSRTDSSIRIASMNESTGQMEYHEIGEVLVHENNGLPMLDISYGIITGQNTVLSVTANHQMGKWTGEHAELDYGEAGMLQNGGLLFTSNSEAAVITGIDAGNSEEPLVYNIHMATGDPNYMVASEPDIDKAVVAHNILK